MEDRFVVRVSGLWKKYDDIFVLRGVSFTVERGSIVAVLGPNGAGKSTLFRVLSGVSFFERGRVFVLGLDVLSDSLLVRERIGFVAEGGMLFPELSVRENLLLAGRLHGLDGDFLLERIRDVAGLLGLESVLDSRYGVLSRGFKRRCDIAAGLLHEPEVLFLDEPTAGLDVLSVFRLREFLVFLRRLGRTVVFSTHNITEAMSLADKVIVLDKGVVRSIGSPDDIRGVVGGVREIILTVSGDVNGFARVLEERVSGLVKEGDRLRFTSMDVVGDLSFVFEKAGGLGIVVRDVVVRDVEWEDVFYRLLEEECDPSCPFARFCMGG